MKSPRGSDEEAEADAFRFPSWPANRVIREAVAAWNVRHQANLLDPIASSWPRLYAAVLCFCRHDLSHYDRMLECVASGQSNPARAALRKQIHSLARKQYPWLRPDIDPRALSSIEEERYTKRDGEKYLDYISRLASEFLSERRHYVTA
jgi:hypothetical protein